MAIYVYSHALKEVMSLSDTQEKMCPPVENGVSTAGMTPLEIATAWCVYWRRHTYKYTPISEDGVTPELFDGASGVDREA